jgi:hypothetical protein
MPATYTFNPFLLDAGMLFVGSTPVGWGPTRGGLRFVPGITTRVPEFDGLSTPIVGQPRVTQYRAQIVGNIADKSPESVGRLLPGYTSDGSTGGSGNNIITPRDARSFISAGESLSDILLVHRGSDGNAEGVWFKYGLVETWEQTGEDNNEVLRAVTILALLPDDDSPNASPFRLINPFDFDTFNFTGW